MKSQRIAPSKMQDKKKKKKKTTISFNTITHQKTNSFQIIPYFFEHLQEIFQFPCCVACQEYMDFFFFT